MWDNAGHKLQIPYGNVDSARARGYKFDTNKDHGGLTPEAAYQKDASAQPVNDISHALTKRAGELYTGAAKGAVGSLYGLGGIVESPLRAIDKVAGSHLAETPEQAVKNRQQFGATPGTLEGIGKGVEQAAEFLVPGSAEEAGAAKLAELAPWAGRAAAPISKALMAATSGAGINAIQGGSPVTGALAGAGGSLVGQGLKAVAPAVTEFAHGYSGRSWGGVAHRDLYFALRRPVHHEATGGRGRTGGTRFRRRPDPYSRSDDDG